MLQELNIDHLDYILLTHIHLDHAGAIGEIAEVFPQTPIVCHQAGLSHLLEPSRLWENTKKILGPMALSYGPIKPVTGNPLVATVNFHSKFVTPIITPGHAAHHVSYQTEKYLFAGETGGVYVSLPQNKFYLRPATPPKFFLNVALQSVDSLIACHPNAICYGHYGINKDAVKMLKIHHGQLLLWEGLIKDEISNCKSNDRNAACQKRLLKDDPLLASFDQLSADVQERERYFFQNSIKGYLGWLDSDDRGQKTENRW
jgi:glyoxylase-like metal-dependent hydrolase (beta-lactamase superfamily II)